MLLASNKISTPAPTSIICKGTRAETCQLRQQLTDAAKSLIKLLEEIQNDNKGSSDRPEHKE